MHRQARNFIAAHAGPGSVLEIGSRNINGGVRDLFGPDYVGIDVIDGPGVDVVCDAVDYDERDGFDFVVCCEVLEHAEDPAALIASAARLLAPGGTLLVTAAGPSRTPHSGLDGGALRDGETYQNIDPADLLEWMGAPLTDAMTFRVGVSDDDVHGMATKAVPEPKTKTKVDEA